MSLITISTVAISAAGAAVLFGLVAIVLARPRRDPPPPEQAVDRTAQLDNAEFGRLRIIADFAATIDLAELSRRVLVVAMEASQADAGAITIECQAPVPSIVESSGLTSSDLEWLAETMRAPNDSSIITRYLYEDPEGLEQRFATALFVPLYDAQGEFLGNLAALWRADLGPEADARVRALSAAVGDATTAITNAVRFHQVSALSIRDTDTGLLSKRYFTGMLDAEVKRAHAVNERLTLILVSTQVDNAEQAALPAADTLVELADQLRFEFGGSQPVYRLGPAVLGVHIPSSGDELQPAIDRLRRQFDGGGTSDGLRGLITSVELERGEDATSLYERAEASLRSIRQGQRAFSTATYTVG